MTTRNKMLLVIDTQVDFVMETGALPVPGAEKIIEPGKAFIVGLDPDVYDCILFTFDTHDEAAYIGSRENLGDEATGAPGFPIHCVKKTYGHSNVLVTASTMLDVSSRIHQFYLEKNVFDMWEQPDLKIGETWHSNTRMISLKKSVYDDMEGPEIAIHLPWNDSYRIDREKFFAGAKAKGVDTVTVIGVAADYCVMWAIRGLLERGFKVEVVEHLTAGIQRDIKQTIADEFPGQVSLI
jgi:nicotinamidase/pyrazinamidase